MKRSKQQSAFSLIEVLFAVMVLTIGLVFVASQFPIGLANSRDIARASTNPINAHNTQTTLSLLLQNEIDAGNIVPSNTNNAFLCTDGEVHFLIQPNYRWNLQDFVLDEVIVPFSAGGYRQYFPFVIPANPQLYRPGPPDIPEYFTTYLYTHGVFDNRLCPENMGMMVSPPVMRFDKEVIKHMQNQGIWPPAKLFTAYTQPDYIIWNNAVFDITSKRNYSWCAFYQYIGTSTTDLTFRFFIFTIELGKNNPHFAPQDPTVGPTAYTAPVPQPQSEDRMFPLPWYVTIFPITPSNILEFPVGTPKDRFILDKYTIPAAVPNVLQLLRPGSVIIDADNGYVYKITEIIYLDPLYVPSVPNICYQIRLDRNLEDYDRFGVPASFQTFWIIPPAINPDRMAFADSQPVIDVTEKVIQF